MVSYDKSIETEKYVHTPWSHISFKQDISHIKRVDMNYTCTIQI